MIHCTDGVQVALGGAHVMALGWFGPGGSEESLLYVWGDNSKGQVCENGEGSECREKGRGGRGMEGKGGKE